MPDQIKSRTILIAGPTASGKSAAALALARKTGGEIVNADAMQVYRDLRIITARPSELDEAAAPHHLYGYLGAEAHCSAGVWSRTAAEIIGEIHNRGRAAIVVGGTGLYFKSLIEGLSPIPDISAESRAAALARREALGAVAFREEVIARDPAMERLPASDAQRLTRAWEVFCETGKPLSFFQDLPREPLLNGPVGRCVIAPDRLTLYARCDARASRMLENGGIEEVRALLARSLDPDLPILKALGVPEISSRLAGEMGEAEAIATLQQNTRRFAKRQLTWFRGQTGDWPVFGDAAHAIDFLVADI